MLELKNIKKVYETKDLKVTALDNVSIKFRENEFVSILGPSGCGKTTTLNIIGGLDQYTSGDLIINGKSTKDFKDRDWDVYRNHTVGFVFQSYNLIPHQTVLENVEIALTLSGISKAERKKRAIEALKKVGLKDKIKSRPNQLSGGQMQRVAIARALVNDPDIVLADEPTGALDSKTSLQVMELLKEISEEKLVIMVTHNPELAKDYSTRIITFLDGKLQEDSNPIVEESVAEEEASIVVTEDGNVEVKKPKKRKKKHSPKTTMSFFTALSLSLKNLLTKKTRTALVSFAGSIGIIGIALILALSSGFQTYVNRVQEDTLSTNPITIESQSVDYTDIIASMMFDKGGEKENDGDAIYSNDSLSQMIDTMGRGLKANNLKKFYDYLNENYSDIEDYVSSIQYTYDVGLEFYDKDNNNLQPSSTALYDVVMQYSLLYLQKETGLEVEEKEDGGYLVKVPDNGNGDWNRTFLDSYKDSSELMQGLLYNLETNGYAELNDSQIASIIYVLMNIPVQMFSTYNMRIFSEMIDNTDLLKEQYDLVGTNSKWADPSASDEVMLVLDSNNSLDDYILYALGMVSKEDMKASLKNVIYGNDPTMKVDYSKAIGREFKVLSDIDYYVNIGTAEAPNYVDIREEFVTKTNYGTQEVSVPTEEYYEYYNSIISSTSVKSVKIVGILRLKENATSGCLSSGIVYTSGLTNFMVDKNNLSSAVVGEFASKIEKDNPESISLYASSFDSKDVIEDFISKYNSKQESEDDKITYTNLIGMVMEGVSTIINAITYVLIAFVSISLVVSSIMIGIITYISVLERIKEIGILRSVGASKRDIKRVFTAETLIIGFISGVLGILVTLILTIPINIILRAVTGINIGASLPVASAFILIGISMLLTFIAGLIPANIASKKDPVTCLRSE